MIRTKPNLKGGVIYEKIYEATLYRDSDIYDYNHVISYVTLYFDDWAYITHDKDRFEESGELKKEHIHLLFKHQNQLSINSVAEKLEIPVNALEWKANWKKSIQYLIHYNNPGKYQYSIEEITSSYGDDIRKFFDNKEQSETEQVVQLYNFIFEQHISKMHDLLKYALENNCYSALRRGSSIFKDILRENERRLQQEKLNKLHEELNPPKTD